MKNPMICWVDGDGIASIEEKIKREVVIYGRKFGFLPNICQMSHGLAMRLSTSLLVFGAEIGAEIEISANVGPNLLRLGQKEGK